MKKHTELCSALILITALLCACGTEQRVTESEAEPQKMEKTGTTELQAAARFSVDQYDDNYMITIAGGGRFFVVSENSTIPGNLPEDVTVLQKPLDKVYLVSTSALDLIREAGALDHIRFSGTKQENWYIPEAKAAMEAGTILYAGKYSAPDYELLLGEGCDLAIENTMIYHNPEVKEKLEELGIPVLVEESSYESDPLGRLEWIRLYGILFDEEDTADAYFLDQQVQMEQILAEEHTNRKVAFFSVNSSGSITVRKPGDYIAEMISRAGGIYALDGIVPEEENALSTMNMQVEDFYAAARDCDVLIYNSTIVGDLPDISSLIEKNAVFADFSAVQSGQVYCTGRNFFQETTGMAEFMKDIQTVLHSGDAGELTYLEKLN